VGKNLKFFPFQFKTVGLLDCFVGFLFFLILNVAYAPACSIVVTFELTFYDSAKFRKDFVKSLLTNGGGNVSDENIGLWVGFMIGLN